jgi:hypothetical protein
LVAAAAALTLLGGCAGSGARPSEPSPTPAVGSHTPDREVGPPDAARGFRSVRDYHQTPIPIRLNIPRIGVASTLDRLGRARDGSVQVPSRWHVAGWYALGPRPGDPGSAVILGHVDSRSGPAVFYRLRELRRGDEIRIARADGSSVRFVVERTEQFDKRRFPTDEVYYPTLTPALRLVTCGGQFDTATRQYRANRVVFATIRT